MSERKYEVGILIIDDQQKITGESIIRAIQMLGKNYLTDDDREDLL